MLGISPSVLLLFSLICNGNLLLIIASCQPGSVHDAKQDRCVPCPAGEFQRNGQKQIICQACPEGTFTAESGSTVCYSCMSGSFASSSGNTGCSLCDIGKYEGSSRSSECIPCPPGSFQYATGSSSCLECHAGSHQEISGTTACVSCPAGMSQAVRGKTECTVCEAGKYSWARGTITCSNCKRGTFQAFENGTACDACLPGTFQGTEGATTCTNCPKGQYCKEIGSFHCIVCYPGSYQPNEQSTFCKECAPGKYQAEYEQADVCKDCDVGLVSALFGSAECQACPPETFQDEPGNSVCHECVPGSFSPHSRSTSCSACLPGTAGSKLDHACSACRPGYYANVAGLSVCMACQPGSFQEISGATSCAVCAPGTYETSLGSTACTLCKPGTYGELSGSVNGSTCITCQSGHFSTGEGQVAGTSCETCRTGSVPNSDQSGCRQCLAGTFCPTGVEFPLSCHALLSCNGTHMDASAGYLPVLQGNCTGVILCPDGTQCAEKKEERGVYSERMAGASVIIFQGGSLMADMTCGALSYGFTGAASTIEEGAVLFYLLPRQCQAGWFLHETLCQPCANGTFSMKSSALGQEGCHSCSAGTFSSSPGATACIACMQGSFTVSEGAVACELCPAGKQQQFSGRTECLDCRPGTFAAELGNAHCQLCAAGEAQPDSGGSGCLTCKVNEQFSSPGDGACHKCRVNLDFVDPAYSCETVLIPSKTNLVWVSARGREGDECAGLGASVIQGSSVLVQTVRRFRGAVCQHDFHLLGHPDVSSTWLEAETYESFEMIDRLRVVPFNQTVYPEFCKEHGFGVIVVAETGDNRLVTGTLFPRTEFSVYDVTHQHLLFQGECLQLVSDEFLVGYCHTSKFCPSMDVAVSVRTTNTVTALEGSERVKVGYGVDCEPPGDWRVMFKLQGRFSPFFDGQRLVFDVWAQNIPLSFLAFQFVLLVRPGFRFVSYNTSFSAIITSVKNEFSFQVDVSGHTLENGILGQVVFEYNATHSGILRVFQVLPDSFRFLLIGNHYMPVAVSTEGYVCKKDGYAEALVDYRRPSRLLAYAKHPSLINWKSVQNNAFLFPTQIHVVAVWNTGEVTSAQNASCRSLSKGIIAVTSCMHIEAVNAGVGVVSVSFGELQEVVKLEIMHPDKVVSYVFPDKTKRYWRIQVLASINGTQQDVTPFVIHQNIPVSTGGSMVGSSGIRCLHNFTGNVSIGNPIIVQVGCEAPESLELNESSIFLLHGGWTSKGSYYFGRSLLAPFSDVATPVAIIGGDIVSEPVRNVRSTDSERAFVSEDGKLRLARKGFSSRCIVLQTNVVDWKVRVIAPTPENLSVVLSSTTLVVQQDLWKLVPNRASVVSATLVFSDQSNLDVTTDPRLFCSVSNNLRKRGSTAVETLHDYGTGYVVFGFLGMPCVSANISVRIHVSSVISTNLLCPTCPDQIGQYDDPLGFVGVRFPVSIPATSFIVRRLLVDGKTVDGNDGLIADGIGEIKNGQVIGKMPGAFNVSSTVAEGFVEIQVIYRWATSLDVLCNSLICNDQMRLTVPGDGASLSPFNLNSSLVLSFQVTLKHGSVEIFEWLPEMSILVNGSTSSPSIDLKKPGNLQIFVDFGAVWAVPRLSNGISLAVSTVSTLIINAPPVLYQVHCSRIWESAHIVIEAVLSSGERGIVSPDLDVDKSFLDFDSSDRTLSVKNAGRGHVNATFGFVFASVPVTATLTSKLFSDLRLDSIPRYWNGVLNERKRVEPELLPAIQTRVPKTLMRRVVRWEVQPEKIVNITEEGELILLSDYYEDITVAGILRSCQGMFPIIFESKIQINVVANQNGQVDIGNIDGLPVLEAKVGELLSLPVFLFAVSPLLRYNASISLPGIYLSNCSVGELPFSQCHVKNNEFVLLQGDYPASQHTGRIFIGSLTGLVLLNNRVSLNVFIQNASYGYDSVSQSNVTYQFAVKLGRGSSQSLVPPYNRVQSGSPVRNVALNLTGKIPLNLIVCCNMAAVSSVSPLATWIATVVKPEVLQLQYESFAETVEMTDPRIEVKYNDVVLEAIESTGWYVKHGVEDIFEDTEVSFSYTHPVSLEKLFARIKVTLAKAERLISFPEALKLKRIHCSHDTFQSHNIAFSVIVRGQAEHIRLTNDFLKNYSSLDLTVVQINLNEDALSVQGKRIGHADVSLSVLGLRTSCNVSVVDENVLLRSFRIPDPYILTGFLGQQNKIRISGILEENETLSDLLFLKPGIQVTGPVRIDGMYLIAMGNTLSQQNSSIQVSLESCDGFTPVRQLSSLVVVLTAQLSEKAPADVIISPRDNFFSVDLAVRSVFAYLIEISTSCVSLNSSVFGKDWPVFSDCVINFPRDGALIMAGTVEYAAEIPDMLVMNLGLVSPMCSQISGTVEAFTGFSVIKNVIRAGHFGPNTVVQAPSKKLPVFDTASLHRTYRERDKDQAQFVLEMLTGRQRLVDARYFSDEFELSLMFRVTDRFLDPDENKTFIKAFFHTLELPDHPDGIVRDGVGIEIPAEHVVDGWYVVQWAQTMPRMKIQVTYEVKTTNSLRAMTYAMQDPIVTGRPRHACPRVATDRASFLVTYNLLMQKIPSTDFLARLACAVQVAPRRLNVKKSLGQEGWTLDIALESFIRIHEVHQVIMNTTLFHTLPKAGRKILENRMVSRVSLAYVNDTADVPIACPPGMFFSSNGTYEKLPLHGVVGLDCYGMSCAEGYSLFNNECVPHTVSINLIWICVIVIFGFLLLISCVLCAMHMGRRSAECMTCPPQPESWPGSATLSHNSTEPFMEEDPGFKNIVVEAYLDDYSQTFLIDDDFSAIPLAPLGSYLDAKR